MNSFLQERQVAEEKACSILATGKEVPYSVSMHPQGIQFIGEVLLQTRSQTSILVWAWDGNLLGVSW